jgi:uncharacterized protein (UPF0303 family)
MNWEQATRIIGVNEIPISDLNLSIIKRKYHTLSLLHHPDKNNNTDEAKIKFQEINEAYSYLNEIYYYEMENDNENTFDEENIFENISINSFTFSYFLKIFINSLFEKKYCDAVYKVVDDILNNYKSISIKIFDGLEKENCLMIYTFIIKYKNLLHLNQDIIDQIRDIILKKYDNVSCYTLNPKINDLFENNVYKLCINEDIYIVPLWHNELHFSTDDNKEFIVLCNPTLPDNMSIDEKNNIVIDFDISFTNVSQLLQNDANFEIQLDINRNITIELSNLFIKKKQQYTLFNAGISTIKDDIYDVEDKSDIIVNINMN